MTRKTSAIRILLLVCLLGLSPTCYAFSGAATTISLTALAEDLKAQRVEKIIVSGDSLEVVRRDGQHVFAQKSSDKSLGDTISSLNVPPALLRNVLIEMMSQNGIQDVAYSVVPAVALLVLAILIAYTILYIGFKLFQITPIPSLSHRVLYLMSVFLGLVLYPGSLGTGPLAYVTEAIIGVSATAVVVRYLFGLLGGKLWYFVAYLFAANALVSLAYVIAIHRL